MSTAPIPTPVIPEPKEPGRHRFRGALALALEGLISLVLALLCFLLFLGVLDLVFPSSVGLRQQLTLERTRRDSWGLESVPGGKRPAAATLKVFSNEVRLRTADQIAWSVARQGGAVHQGDAIQTRRDGQAMLRFTDGSTLRLGRNSLLVVRDNQGGGGSAYQVPQGELWGTAPTKGEAELVRVNTPSAEVVVEPSTSGGRPAAFKVFVGPDRSSIVAVYRGTASVVTGDRTQQVTENHFVAVDSLGMQTRPSRLPDAPTLTGPPDGARYIYRDPPPRFSFEWTPVKGADAYRLEVSQDPAFTTVVLDRRVSVPSLEFGRLGTGHYVWRVSTVRDEVEGRPSPPATLNITRDGDPPRLDVAFPEGAIATQSCTITGKVEVGCRVFVAGEPAEVGKDGRFTAHIQLKRGKNVVVVEALDTTGNAAYVSRILEARY